MKNNNSYEDEKRAAAYAKLDFPGTYYLAFRDLPEIIARHVTGKKALDFGCGAGRSSRFLQNLEFEVIGIDISKDMVKKAKNIDPEGDYRVINDGDFSLFPDKTFDLVLSAFTFDNISAMDSKIKILQEIKRVLKIDGIMINLVSSPEIYINEWVSFSTKDFPENKKAKSGDKVRIIITDTDDKRPVEDIVCTDDDYQNAFKMSGLKTVKMFKPLAKTDEAYQWINETKTAPWVIYILN